MIMFSGTSLRWNAKSRTIAFVKSDLDIVSSASHICNLQHHLKICESDHTCGHDAKCASCKDAELNGNCGRSSGSGGSSCFSFVLGTVSKGLSGNDGRGKSFRSTDVGTLLGNSGSIE